MYTTKSNTEIGIVVGVIVLIIIFAVWYYMTHNSVACTDSTGCTVGANLACISGKCGPVTCTGDPQCTTAPNTICDVTSGSKTFGTCIPPGSCKDSTTCMDANNPACVSNVCGSAVCTTANQASICTTAPNTQCDVTLTPTKSGTYGTCVAPPPVPCKTSTDCTDVNNPACVSNVCGPAVCTTANQASTCTTAPNTQCDVTSGSKTFGTCISPPSIRRRRY